MCEGDGERVLAPVTGHAEVDHDVPADGREVGRVCERERVCVREKRVEVGGMSEVSNARARGKEGGGLSDLGDHFVSSLSELESSKYFL